MKKAILILGTVIINTLLTSTVYAAGTLNAYEQEIVNAARGAYEYEGADYVVKQEFIDELIAYLSDAGVDLTAGERDTVLQKAFSNVEKGVKEGYMIPLQEEDTDGQDSTVETGQIGDENSSSEPGYNGNENSSTPNGTAADYEDLNKPESGSEESSPVDTIGKILDGQENTDLPVDSRTEAPDTNIIKATGFNLESTIYTLIGMGVLMIAGMLVTIKYNFFAHKNE